MDIVEGGVIVECEKHLTSEEVCVSQERVSGFPERGSGSPGDFRGVWENFGKLLECC